MADIFDIEPPRWLQDLTHSSEKGLLGSIAGGLVAGGIVAGEHAAEPDEKRNWFQLLPQSIGEAKMSFLDPMWKLKMQQTQLGIAHTGLQMQEMQQQIEMNKTAIRDEAEDVATIPPWMRDHATEESRRGVEWPVAKTAKWNRNLDQLRLRDSQSSQSKTIAAGVKLFGDRITALGKSGDDGATAAAQIAGSAAQYTQRGEMPPPELLQSLSYAEQAAQQRKENERNAAIAAAQAAGQVPETRISEKGITTIYKPMDTATSTARARVGTEMTLPSGIHAIWIGPNQIRITEKSGSATDFTPGQLLQYAAKFKNSANPTSRATAQEIEKFIAEKAKAQVSGQTTTPSATTNALPTKPVAVLGQGTLADPSRPTTQEQFDSISSGAVFLNPADGKLYRKK